MIVNLEKIGKRFNKEWIFRNLTTELTFPNSYAITGYNGSGKSTLLQVIAGNLLSSEGKISYQDSTGAIIDPNNVYQFLSFTAPYLDIIEELTLQEFLKFHFKFKKVKSGIDFEQIPEMIQLEKSKNKYIKNFSTGMRQRLKLGVSFCSDTPMVLLDEPTSNLDQAGKDWYLEMIKNILGDRLLIICSNNEFEYQFCDHKIDILDYKK